MKRIFLLTASNFNKSIATSSYSVLVDKEHIGHWTCSIITVIINKKHPFKKIKIKNISLK
jgi:hypothetical protein